MLNTLHVTFNNYGPKTQISRSHITHKVARYKHNPRLTDHFYNILQVRSGFGTGRPFEDHADKSKNEAAKAGFVKQAGVRNITQSIL